MWGVLGGRSPPDLSCDELRCAPDRDLDLKHGRAVGPRLVRRLAAQELEPFAPANAGLELAVGRELATIGLQEDVERIFFPGHPEDQILRLPLVDPLDEGVLDEAEDRDLVIRGQPAVAANA